MFSVYSLSVYSLSSAGLIPGWGEDVSVDVGRGKVGPH